MSAEKRRMPQLVIDEVILLVDMYFQLKDINDRSEKNEMISELSAKMRSLPFFPEWTENSEFRSTAGMSMCLANVGYVDPESNSKFGHGSALQKKVFDRYVDHKKELHNLAKAIVAVAAIQFPIDYSFSDSEIGMLIPSYHIFVERTNKQVKFLKRELLLMGKNKCYLCHQDLEEKYLDSDELLEIHIGRPVYNNTPDRTPIPTDMVGVCPTCHKLMHSSFDMFEVAEAKKRIRL